MLCYKCRSHFCSLCPEIISRNDPYAHYRESTSHCHYQLFFGVPAVDPFVVNWVDGQVDPMPNNIPRVELDNQPDTEVDDDLELQIEQLHFEQWIVSAVEKGKHVTSGGTVAL